eukprot:210213_1
METIKKSSKSKPKQNELNNMDNQHKKSSKSKPIKNKSKKHKPSTKEVGVWPSRRRFCIFIDRRNNQNYKMEETKSEQDEDQKLQQNETNQMDHMAIYNPPNHEMPPSKEFVDTWHHEAMRECIIPRKNYGDGNKETEIRKEIHNLRSEERSGRISITSQDTCAGQIATFSFRVVQSGEIKCYLCWNGQTFRFYPQDIMEVLPHIFVDKVSWIPPKAKLITNKSEYKVNEEIIFDASKSKTYGLLNGIIEYRYCFDVDDNKWRQSDNNTIKHKFRKPGIKTIRLIVTDKKGIVSSMDKMKLNIINKNDANNDDKKERKINDDE